MIYKKNSLQCKPNTVQILHEIIVHKNHKWTGGVRANALDRQQKV